MKTIMVILVAALACLVMASIVIFRLATPQLWPLTHGELKVKKVVVGDQSYIMMDGVPMNKFGQVQSLNVALDFDTKKLVVSRYIARWIPFSKVTINNQWPVFYPIDGLKPGKYEVVYLTEKGEVIAGSFDVQ